MLIDTHTHLDDARYNDDREAMIARAREAGVDNFITIGCDLATSQSAVALAGQHDFIYASIGVHPHEVKHIQDTWYDEFRRLAKNRKVVAYGEIGLDYHYNHSSPKEQRDRFREQIQLAHELRLPAIRDRCEIGAVGFDQESIQRNGLRNVPQRRGARERQNAGKRQVESQVERIFCQCRISGKAVEHPADFRRLLFL